MKLVKLGDKIRIEREPSDTFSCFRQIQDHLLCGKYEYHNRNPLHTLTLQTNEIVPCLTGLALYDHFQEIRKTRAKFLNDFSNLLNSVQINENGT